jgi:hypothetical protein
MTDRDDRQLLEAAARAAGIELRWHPDGTAYADTRAPGYWGVWNPLADDGDALRLAVKLNLRLVFHPALNQALVRPYHCGEKERESTENGEDHADPNAATRRAIVSAAAAMVKEG